MADQIDIPELNTPVLFWACPVCVSPRIAWKGKVATCCECDRRNTDTVCCQCGKPAIYNAKTRRHCGICGDCIPF